MKNPNRAVSPRPERRAFTLIELLTVVGIIGVLSAILIPTVGGAVQTAKTAKCANNLRQLYNASLMYASENNGFWPASSRNRIPGCANARSWADVMLYYTVFNAMKGRDGQSLESALTQAAQRLHRDDSPLVCPCDPSPRQLGSALGEDYNCQSYGGTVDTVYSVSGSTEVFYTFRTDDPLRTAATLFLADTGSTGRPPLPRNTASARWPNRHGGNPDPGNDGSKNPQGRNNILFYDGHVEALREDEIPMGDATDRFWAPLHTQTVTAPGS